LNHAHIFTIPFQPGNGLDLDAFCPGLAACARPFVEDVALREMSVQLGRECYLADGPCLLHGDFFPGSLVRTPKGPQVLDPEFGFFGRPEFDVAVFAAHLLLAHQPAGSIAMFLRGYQPRPDFNVLRMRQLAGIEIFRRILGYAQLPLPSGLLLRQELLEIARQLVLRPKGTVATTLFSPAPSPSFP
jgi:5-methylthioribose kinase